MPRKGPPRKRDITPDPVYGSVLLARFTNRLLTCGKKSKAETIMYGALDLMEDRTKKPGIEVFEQAIRNVMPTVEIKPRRVGGATYQIPIEVPSDRRVALALRWIIGYARRRAGKTMVEKLAGELMDAASNTGASVKKREDSHRMAEANKAFAHYRW
ncbi:MAG: 30S ribosomal protein S7 [Armatimonadota bacterium]|nr:30S ribosomal protein S7 [Armatimonadota bacterium]